MRSMGRVRGLLQDKARCGDIPLTFPLLRNGSLPLPQGERGFACRAMGLIQFPSKTGFFFAAKAS